MEKSSRFLHWTPRILGIVAILFISLFALDSFDPSLTILKQTGNFLMHMIPSFVLLAVLIYAWKHELAGGFIFVILGLGMSPSIFLHNYKMNHSIAMSLLVILMVTLPFILIGILFILNHRRKRKTSGENHEAIS